jgi:hypothetical protein
MIAESAAATGSIRARQAHDPARRGDPSSSEDARSLRGREQVSRAAGVRARNPFPD